MKTFSLVIFMTFLIAGCVTVADIRNKEPYQTLESSKSPKEIADNIMFNAPAKVFCVLVPYYRFHLSEQPSGTFHILAELPDGPPMGEVDLSPSKTGTHIELRSRSNFWAKDSFLNCIRQASTAP